MLASVERFRYSGDYSRNLMKLSGEDPITSYAPNHAEWFAEIFRLFVTNHALLKLLRPKAYSLIVQKWKPISSPDWVEALGTDVPSRILLNLRKKIQQCRT
jgi:hypothetical protein